MSDERAAERLATRLQRECEMRAADTMKLCKEIDGLNAIIAELRKEVERLRASLNLVAQLDGQTLLGPSDLDFDHLTKRVPDQCWAHEVGAARAFNQAAEIAKEALKEHGTL